jgi:deoxyribodipyrimidine photolyase
MDAFGPYEDAVAKDNWAMHHSLLSPYINNGLLHPAEVIAETIKAYEKNGYAIQSVEAFIRQVNEKKVNANNRNDVMARSLKVFDESLKNTSRLSATESEGVAAVAYCRNTIRSLLNKVNNETSTGSA